MEASLKLVVGEVAIMAAGGAAWLFAGRESILITLFTLVLFFALYVLHSVDKTNKPWLYGAMALSFAPFLILGMSNAVLALALVLAYLCGIGIMDSTNDEPVTMLGKVAKKLFAAVGI